VAGLVIPDDLGAISSEPQVEEGDQGAEERIGLVLDRLSPRSFEQGAVWRRVEQLGQLAGEAAAQAVLVSGKGLPFRRDKALLVFDRLVDSKKLDRRRVRIDLEGDTGSAARIGRDRESPGRQASGDAERSAAETLVPRVASGVVSPKSARDFAIDRSGTFGI
jgi:hypothetical protein